MGRSNYQLNDDAMRLLGDVSLLLNLVYCAEPWSEHEWRLLGTTSQLPACIRRPGAPSAVHDERMPAGLPARSCARTQVHPGDREAAVSCPPRSARRSMTSPNGSGPRRGTRDVQRNRR